MAKKRRRVKRVHPKYNKWARALYRAVKTARRGNCAANLETWAKQLSLLVESDLVDEDGDLTEPRARATEVLKAYCILLKKGKVPKYMPQGFSGPAFREKFYRIEAYLIEEGHISQEEPEKFDPVTLLTSKQKEIYDGVMVNSASQLTTSDIDRDYIPAMVVAVQSFNTVMATDAKQLRWSHWAPGPSVYLQWILQESESWDSWQGSLKDFMPGAKHFLRWHAKILKQRGISKREMVDIDDAVKVSLSRSEPYLP